MVSSHSVLIIEYYTDMENEYTSSHAKILLNIA